MNIFNDLHQIVSRHYDVATLRTFFEKNLYLFKVASGEVNDTNGQTHLLYEVENLNNSSVHGVAVAFLLAIQTENLPDAAVQHFMRATLNFLRNISNYKSIDQCHAEGITFILSFSFCRNYYTHIYGTVSAVCHTLTPLACKSGYSKLVIRPLVLTCQTLSPNVNCLTSIHSDVLQVIEL
jgi:hypothetical protein